MDSPSNDKCPHKGHKKRHGHRGGAGEDRSRETGVVVIIPGTPGTIRVREK